MTTVLDMLRSSQPEIMKEFDAAPWNFTVIGPAGLEDAATIVVYLYIGKRKTNKIYRIELLLALTSAVVSC